MQFRGGGIVEFCLEINVVKIEEAFGCFVPQFSVSCWKFLEGFKAFWAFRMLPNSSTPTNFVYLNKPVSREKRFPGIPLDFLCPSPIPPESRHLRDVTNWSPSPQARKLAYDPETLARIAQEEKALRLRQDKRRQRALKAMQISEDRRRRLQHQEVENLAQGLTDLTIESEMPKKISKQNIFRQSLAAFEKDAGKTLSEAIPLAHSSPIIRYTLEELKSLRQCNN